MSIEKLITDLLSPLAEVYPDAVAEDATFPCISYQQIGGRAGWYMEGAMPSHKHARIQINVWAKTRVEASTLAREIEGAICTSALIAEPYGAATATHEPLVGLYGTRQDFGIWFPD